MATAPHAWRHKTARRPHIAHACTTAYCPSDVASVPIRCHSIMSELSSRHACDTRTPAPGHAAWGTSTGHDRAVRTCSSRRSAGSSSPWPSRMVAKLERHMYCSLSYMSSCAVALCVVSGSPSPPGQRQYKGSERARGGTPRPQLVHAPQADRRSHCTFLHTPWQRHATEAHAPATAHVRSRCCCLHRGCHGHRHRRDVPPLNWAHPWHADGGQRCTWRSTGPTA